MLWESADPAQALRQRFGFADPAAAAGWVGDVLSARWAIAVDDCERLVISAGNLLAWVTADGRRLIAKWSAVPELFQRLADTAALTMWLHARRGVPVAAPIPAADGHLRVELGNVSVGVFPVIGGALLDAGNLARVTEAGHMLAALHDAMAAYPHRIGGGPAPRRQQLVHNDFRSANILHDGTRITAVLDFEDVTYQTRTADLAKAAVLLATRYRNWIPTSQAVREAFTAAYCDRAPLTSAEQTELRHRITAVEKKLGWHRTPADQRPD